MTTTHASRALLALFLVGAAACRGSSGGGGSGGNAITLDRATGSSTLAEQAADDQTVLRWRFRSERGGKALCGLEYRAGLDGAWTAIPTSFLAGATGGPSATTFEVDTLDSDADYRVTWRHREHLGLPSNEARAIAVRLRTAAAIGDGELAQDVQLVATQTLGRQAGVLKGPGGTDPLAVVRSDPGNHDSAFVVTGELADHGGDVAATTVQVSYATKRSPAAGDWTLLPAPEIAFGAVKNPDAKADEALVYPLTIRVDPHAAGALLPLGSLSDLSFRVTYQEDSFARFPAAGRTPASQEAFTLPAPAIVGKAPILARVALPASEVRHVVPIAVALTNPSTRTTDLVVTGRYTYGTEARQGTMTFRQDDPAQPDRPFVRIPVGGATSVTRSVLWNAVRDLGMGAGGDLDADQVHLSFTVTSADALNVVERTLLFDSLLAPDPAPLQTHPFAATYDRHDAVAARVVEGARATGQRDVFTLATSGTLSSVAVVGRANALANPDWSPFFLTGEVVEGLVPLRLGRGGPACAAILRSGSVRVAEWPSESADENAPTSSTIAHGAAGRYSGYQFAGFPRGGSAFTLGGKELFAFVTYDGPTLNGSTGRYVVEYILNVYVRQLDGSWKWTDNTSSQSTLRLQTTFATLPPALDPHFVIGELDRDPATAEIVVASVSLNRTEPEAALGLFRLSVGAQDEVSATRRVVPAPDGWLAPNESAAAVKIALHRDLVRSGNESRAGIAFAVDVATTQVANQSLRVFTALLDAPTTSWNAVPPAGPAVPAIADVLRELLVEDLDGDGMQDIAFVRSRSVFAWRPTKASLPAAWVRASFRSLEENSELAGFASAGFVDVDGDARLDLALVKGTNLLRFATSAYAGAVTSYRAPLTPLTIVGGEANFVKYCARPLALDFNLDGVGPDHLVNGEVLLRRVGAPGFVQVDASLDPVRWGGNPRSTYWLDRLSPNLAANDVDVLTYETSSPSTTPGAVFQVTRITLGHRPVASAQRPLVVRDDAASPPFSWRLDFARPVATQDGEKWILALAHDERGAGAHGLLRFAFDGSKYVPQGTSLYSGEFLPEFAAVRRGVLVPGATDLARNTMPQDVFVAPLGGREVRWLRSEEGYTSARRAIQLPRASEVVLRLAAASVGTDSFEDLVVLTREPLTGGRQRLRLYALAQDPATGFETANPVLMSHFNTAPGVDSVLGLDFDRSAQGRAQGAVAFELFGSSVGETRIVRHDPTAPGGYRVLVCPCARFDSGTQELTGSTLQILDQDRDGTPALLIGPTYKVPDPPLPNPRTVYLGEW